MLLMPDQNWQWKYNASYDVLSISLGPDMEFLTPYKNKVLIPDALGSSEFDVEHARYYMDIVERLGKRMSLADAYLVQLALNATAARFMLKPQMPKSWFFESSDVCVFSEPGKLFDLRCNGNRVQVLVVETSLQASLVMSLEESCALSDSKNLKRFDTIKVMHDRLHPLRAQQQIVAA
ncbi:cell division protein ZapC [Shewanella mangrovi]|uniref:Cell division protein ZapC n=1 Tax=Shewanella mangrovi TaxID=1515746 RepID=A0A094JKK8_9GAMM|nr:cell division protein ZapC [Shewanella mangrovi]KFZ38594.1 cell division protein ZapC [Shewanella mangrovi]